MRKQILRSALFLTLIISSAITLWGQEITPSVDQEEITKVEPDSLQALPVEATKITEAFTKSNTLILESAQKQSTKEVISEYMEEVNSLFSLIAKFLADSSVVARNGVSLRELDVISQQADYYYGEVNLLQENLSGKTRELNVASQLLVANRLEWEG